MMVAAMAVISCTTTELDPLKGIYPEAKEPALTTLAESSCSKTETTRVFKLMFTGDATLEAYLVGARNQYYLESNVYGPGESNGCFLTDPEAVKLTEVLQAQANANNTVTVKLGTAGMSVDMMGTPNGDGFALTADLYSPDGFLHEGTYMPAAGDPVGDGQYAPGYEYDLSEWGMGIMHWGTCWWANGNATHITSGPITVAKKGTKYVITWGDESTYPNWAVFEGEIEALTPSDAPGSETPEFTITEELSDAVDNTFAPVPGVKTHNLTLKNAAGEEAVWFQLVLTEGVTDLSGEYTCVEYAHEDHTFGNGYDLSAWGMGVGGSRYLKDDGSVVLVNPGETLTVTLVGDQTYKFAGSTGYSFVAAF